MGILDEAIKEHLELKRQHGADASELKQLENEAFGAAERPGDEDSAPDPLAEAPTQFMQRPEGLDAEGEAALEAEAPPGTEDEPGRSPRTELADLQEPPPAPEVEESEEEAQEPAEEESPAIEHEPVPEPAPEPDPEPSSSHTTAEREAIAEHPTEMYDVEAELGPGEPQAPAEETPAAPEPAEEAPVDEAPVQEEDPEDFFDEQRLSEELDQALEAPAEEDLAEDEYDEEPGGEAEDETPEEDGGAPEALRPAEGEEDVLEETPDFLEEAPEDDRLWFEQKPPKDFDFDD